jgi:hypothetical protein
VLARTIEIEHEAAVNDVRVQPLRRRQALIGREQRTLGSSCELRLHQHEF